MPPLQLNAAPLIVAQFSAGEIPYDALDWLQIGFYFAVLPLVAACGAAIALLGRWRRGGFLWSTNVGLLGGAVGCLIFALGMMTLDVRSGTTYLNFFLAEYRWSMLLMNLGGVLGCAAAAGLAWRLLHAPREVQPFAFSIRNLLLVQFFALISLASFLGLRHAMFEKGETWSIHQREAQRRGWLLSRDGRQITVDYANLSPRDLRRALSPANLAQIARLPQIEYVGLVHLGDEEGFSEVLSPFLHHPTVRHLSIECTAPAPDLLRPLAASQIEILCLGGDIAEIDLLPLNQASALRTLVLSGDAPRESLEKLAVNTTLRSLILRGFRPGRSRTPIAAWPPQLESLVVFQSEFMPRDFDSLAHCRHLQNITIRDTAFDAQTIDLLAALPELRSVGLKFDSISPDIAASLAKLPPETLLALQLEGPNFTAKDVARLQPIPRMNGIRLVGPNIDDDVVRALAQLKDIPQIYIEGAPISEEALLQLAELPTLTQLTYPFASSPRSFEDRFRQRRSELGLPSVQLFAH